MWKCSICAQENQRGICRTCGQLREDDYVANRTLCPVPPADVRDALSRRREYEAQCCRQEQAQAEARAGQERIEQLEQALRSQDRKLKEMEEARRNRTGLGWAIALGLGLILLAVALGFLLRPLGDRITEPQSLAPQESIQTAPPEDSILSDTLTAANALMEEQNYEAAIALLRESRESCADSPEYLRVLAGCEKLYAEQILMEVELRMEDGERQEALEVLRMALEVLPGDNRLTQTQAVLMDMEPVPLTDLEPFEKDEWNWNLQDPIDAFGNDYSTSCNYFVKNSFYETSWVEYRLDGGYREISGLLAPHQSMKGDDKAVITIFADDVQVYSESITRKTDPMVFTADISGADYIKIQVKVNNISGWSIGKLILAQVRLGP